MKITSIKQQVKNPDRYSVFVDDEYSFSLSAQALLDAHIASGDELDGPQVEEFKRQSADDKKYNAAIRYIAMRPRSVWELQTYLERKDCPAPLIEQITNKLIKLDLLNDHKFAAAFIADRRLLRPSSRRKLSLELKKRHIANDIIEDALGHEPEHDTSALSQLVERKRRQTRYQDDTKLMQYLARQGFNYDDIKRALALSED